MVKENKAKVLWKLFLTTLYISDFTFGGGFVIIIFMKKKFVDEIGWISEQEMLDYTALAQASPGAIAVNSAILVGWKVAGPAGMLVAVLGTIIPPMVILSVISIFYSAFISNTYVSLVLGGMQSGVAAVILSVASSMIVPSLKKDGLMHGTIMVIAFCMTFFFRINVVLIILTCAALGLVVRTARCHWGRRSVGHDIS